MEHPRKVYKIKTQYFDILFSNENLNTAYFLAQNADRFFEEVKKETVLDYDFRMPVIISPDSEIFSVEYSTSPYNRIIIFDWAPSQQQDYNTLSECFKRELAVSQLKALRSEGSKIVAKISDNFRPVELTHLPENFITGAGRCIISLEENSNNLNMQFSDFVNDSENQNAYENFADFEMRHFSDFQCRQFFLQAKIDGCFPSWMQAFSIRDIYPGKKLFLSANEMFNAFLIQNYGLEKYDRLWELAAQINFYFTAGIFYSAYSIPLDKLWKQFEDSISFPENLAQIEAYENYSENVFANDLEAAYDFILSTDYGIVWYDKIRNEVDLYDSSSDYANIRELLFLASGIKNLTLSDDGRYLVVSYEQRGHRKNFVDYKTEIYDLYERKFLKNEYGFADASIIKLLDGTFAVAGISYEKDSADFKILTFEPGEKKSSVIYEKSLLKGNIVSNIGTVKNGTVYYLLEDSSSSEKNQYLCFLDLENQKEIKVQIFYDDADMKKDLPLKILNLKKSDFYGHKNQVLVFQFFSPEKSDFSRFGFIDFKDSSSFDFENLFTQKIFIQNFDLFGGVNSPVIKNNSLFYSSQKFNHSELKFINTDYLAFSEGRIREVCFEEFVDSAASRVANVLVDVVEDEEFVNAAEEKLSDNAKENSPTIFKDSESNRYFLNEYPLSWYLPFPYFFPPSVIPFFAVKEVSLESGASLAPALGFTLKTGSDPLDNTKVTFSANAGFAKLHFEKFFTSTFQVIEDLTNDAVRDIANINSSEKKNLGAAIYIENFSTPVDLKLASVFNFNTKGEYEFTALAGTSWTIPFRMNFRNLTLGVNGFYAASTDYYDSNLEEYNPSLKNWPSFSDAYEIFLVWAGVEYSNIHQYGISKYEERGLLLGTRLYTIWDIYEKKLLDERKAKLEEGLSENASEGLTQAQIDELYNEQMLDISQFNLSFYADIKIPRLTPLQMKNGWVLSVPTSIHAEFLKENGNAINVCLESLLLGNEIQNGLPFLQLFVLRSGLKFGYDFNLNYDTAEVPLPDIRRENYLGSLLSKTYVSDSLYLLYDMDFTSPLGYLSKIQFNTTLKFEFFPRTSAFKLGFQLMAYF